MVAAGSLGLFPIYYAFSQDLSRKHQGKITGTMGFLTWVASAYMQEAVGSYVRKEQSYGVPLVLASVAPLVALAALLILWRPALHKSRVPGENR